jgi:hypothetical protein
MSNICATQNAPTLSQKRRFYFEKSLATVVAASLSERQLCMVVSVAKHFCCERRSPIFVAADGEIAGARADRHWSVVSERPQRITTCERPEPASLRSGAALCERATSSVFPIAALNRARRPSGADPSFTPRGDETDNVC